MNRVVRLVEVQEEAEIVSDTEENGSGESMSAPCTSPEDFEERSSCGGIVAHPEVSRFG